jgi:hypothetical protein
MVLSSALLNQPFIVADTNRANLIPGLGINYNRPINIQKNFPTSFKDVRLPPNQLWDYNAVYNHRFCFNHSKTKYLLRTANRWISPGNFDIADTAALLEIGLQRHKNNSLDFKLYL